MVAIDSAAMIVWLSPTTMVRRAIGSCTRRSSCHAVWPERSVASTRGRRHLADAVRGDPDDRRQRRRQRGDDRGARPDAEEQRDRREVDEGRQRLHQVEHGRDDRADLAAGAIQTPSGRPISTASTTATKVTISVSIASCQ